MIWHLGTGARCQLSSPPTPLSRIGESIGGMIGASLDADVSALYVACDTVAGFYRLHHRGVRHAPERCTGSRRWAQPGRNQVHKIKDEQRGQIASHGMV